MQKKARKKEKTKRNRKIEKKSTNMTDFISTIAIIILNLNKYKYTNKADVYCDTGFQKITQLYVI